MSEPTHDSQQRPATFGCRNLVIALLLLCADTAVAQETSNFGDYWYQGKAEITSYRLEQARYGEMRQGDAVLIFVTEPFSQSKQVKLDHPQVAKADAVNVLKLNLTKKFTTGIYPYSMMMSTFTPIPRDDPWKVLKVTTSSQEWCGHTFTQLNAGDDGYSAELRSYFESEGDQELDLGKVLLEDSIWSLIRLSPIDLPTGEIEIVPGTLYQRLSHQPLVVQSAVATLAEQDDDLIRYRLHYPDLERTLIWTFERVFPHRIQSWEETRKSGFGPSDEPLTTRATLNKRILLEYWRYNSVADETWRSEMGLD